MLGASFVIVSIEPAKSAACASPISTCFSKAKALMMISSGIVSSGAAVSTMVTVSVALAELPELSTTVH